MHHSAPDIRPDYRRAVRGAYAAALLLAGACATGGHGRAATTGRYTAILLPVNGSGVTGEARITLAGDSVRIAVAASGLDPGVAHLQNLHAGDHCPAAAQDTNEDSFIDFAEGRAAYGAALVPLDFASAAPETSAARTAPRSDSAGQIHFVATVPYRTLVSGAQRTGGGISITRGVLTGQTRPLGFDHRTIVLHGVAPATTLPPSVHAAAGLTPQQSLPVACGVLRGS